jgi:hypothetical protein
MVFSDAVPVVFIPVACVIGIVFAMWLWKR